MERSGWLLEHEMIWPVVLGWPPAESEGSRLLRAHFNHPPLPQVRRQSSFSPSPRRSDGAKEGYPSIPLFAFLAEQTR